MRRDSLSTTAPNTWPPLPPPEESEAEKAHRLESEREAKKISDDIDRAIEKQREEMKRDRPQTKLLLLGQAESGKSTVLKNFQLQFTPKAFKAESGAWRAVIHLNLVRSVNFILDLVFPPPSSSPDPHSPSSTPPPPLIEPTDDLRRLKMRLSPLRKIEEMLSKRISADTRAFVGDRASEVSVRSGGGWKASLKLVGKGKREGGGKDTVADELEDAGRVIEACREDVVRLWEDGEVQEGLRGQEIKLEEQSGFFLGEVNRIASRDYEPTPDDILRCRLKTEGVEEHKLVIETGNEVGKTWVICDVGGSRGQRPAWAPFFDDVNIIIFLAPISAFNQTLSEDRSVNRLWDSFYLWQSICSNKILANVTIILLLNKVDVLEQKLNAGVEFGKYVTSYKEGGNDVEHVGKYLKAKFSAIHKQHSNRLRKLHVHLTTATDHRATSIILVRIRELILTNNLVDSDFVI